MKVVIAPDSFKESLTALEVAEAVERGFLSVFPEAEILKIPMADGGEGTVRSLIDATGGRLIPKKVTGPIGRPVEAFFGVLGNGKTAVIEMAAASGLHLVPGDLRNPLVTSTYGTGELILAALDYGAERIIIGIGGSATNDGGSGMAKALGVKFLDSAGLEIVEGGGGLSGLAQIDIGSMDERIRNVLIEVACDVTNPLTGENGASAVFGPQKGATPEMVDVLDNNLVNYAAIIEKSLKQSINNIPGAGAAGGLGAGLLAFLQAELKSGVDIIIEAVNLADKMHGADFVITGEGKIDGQSIYGKTPIGVAKTAKKLGIPVIAIAGHVADDSDVVRDHGIDAVFSIVPGAVTLGTAIENASSYIEKLTVNLATMLKLAK